MLWHRRLLWPRRLLWRHRPLLPRPNSPAAVAATTIPQRSSVHALKRPLLPPAPLTPWPSAMPPLMPCMLRSMWTLAKSFLYQALLQISVATLGTQLHQRDRSPCPGSPCWQHPESEGTNTLFVIPITAMPAGCKATYLCLVFSNRNQKAQPRHVHFTVGGDRINYPSEVSTKMAMLIPCLRHSGTDQSRVLPTTRRPVSFKPSPHKLAS
jgi:hypothetical protein